MSLFMLGAGCTAPVLKTSSPTTTMPPSSTPEVTPKPEAKPVTKPTTPKPNPKPVVKTQVTVKIANHTFQPDAVTIKPGMSVVWVNNDSVAHTVTAYDGSFDSGSIPPGGSYKFTFDRPVSHSYYCTLHPSMSATVVVHYQ